MQHDAKLVVVQSCSSRVEAELAKGALENAGIEAMIQSDTAGKMRDHLAWTGAGFRILVREEDVPTARDVLTPKTDDPDGDFEADREP
jgi:hypothetical protein